MNNLLEQLLSYSTIWFIWEFFGFNYIKNRNILKKIIYEHCAIANNYVSASYVVVTTPTRCQKSCWLCGHGVVVFVNYEDKVSLYLLTMYVDTVLLYLLTRWTWCRPIFWLCGQGAGVFVDYVDNVSAYLLTMWTWCRRICWLCGHGVGVVNDHTDTVLA